MSGFDILNLAHDRDPTRAKAAARRLCRNVGRLHALAAASMIQAEAELAAEAAARAADPAPGAAPKP
jgi:hypothetical protein